MTHVAVVGAGIAGLTVALRRLARGDRVTLFEACDRVGGQLHTQRSEDFVIEHGAEGFLAKSPPVHALAESIGVESKIVGQSVTDSCHYDGRRLIRLPPGEAGRLLGFQVSPRALGRGIESFDRGMSQLAECMLPSIERAEVRLSHAVVGLRRRRGGGVEVLTDPSGTLQVDQVVLAVPAAAAARLLVPDFGPVAEALAESPTVSSATVSLAFEREAIDDPLDATGFVVAEDAQGEGFRACSFSSSKLPSRAPANRALLRVFFRPGADELGRLQDADWSARAERCVRRVFALRSAPLRSWVSRWESALPVFDADHQRRVAELETELAGSPIVLAGAAFHGSGIHGAVASAERAANSL